MTNNTNFFSGNFFEDNSKILLILANDFYSENKLKNMFPELKDFVIYLYFIFGQASVENNKSYIFDAFENNFSIISSISLKDFINFINGFTPRELISIVTFLVDWKYLFDLVEEKRITAINTFSLNEINKISKYREMYIAQEMERKNV